MTDTSTPESSVSAEASTEASSAASSAPEETKASESVASDGDLFRQSEIAADYIEGLLDILDYDGDIDELVSAGHLAADRRPGSDVACWAAVHGFSELCLDGPLRLMPADLRTAALERLLDTVDRGLA